MNQHDDIRDLLTLAAAGALDAAEQRQVEEHLRQCADCRAELDSWQRLTGALEALPTPQAPLGLVERSRGRLESQAALGAQHRRKQGLFFTLTVCAWMFSVLTWLGFRMISGPVTQILGVSSITLTLGWVAYTLVSWLMSGLVAAMLGKRYQQEGRTA
jgi:anti-sigma factor RsiW